MSDGGLFSVNKVGLVCDALGHSTEKRKDGEVKIIVLTLRVQPFDAKLAAALRDVVRTTLFRMSDAEPHGHITRVNFALGIRRQRLEIFATPDTVKASIALDQVKISGLYARTEQGMSGYALVFKASLGPAGARELEYAEFWRNNMAFVTFALAEPSAEFEDPEPDQDDDEADNGQLGLPEPMFDTLGDGRVKEPDAEAPPAAASDAGGQKRRGKGPITH